MGTDAAGEAAQAQTIGGRVRSCRRYRGMSLETLAGLSGLSKGFLSMVENGQRRLDRRSHLAAVADALQVSITDLTGQPYPPANPAHARALAAVPAVRLALLDTSLDHGHDSGVPAPSATPLAVLAERAAEVTRLAQDSELAGLGPALPGLLTALHAHVAAGGATRDEALRLLVNVLRASIIFLKSLGYHDLSWIAADRCANAARMLGDPAWIACAEFPRALALYPAGAYERAGRMALQAADALQPHLGQPEALPVYGILHLTAAHSHVVGGRRDGIDDHLAEAADVAARTGETDTFDLHFGPTNLAFWRIAVAVELGDGGKVTELARGVDPHVIRSKRRQASYYTDLGRGLAQARSKDLEALAMFRQAEALAPQQVRTNPQVRDAVTVMLQRARSSAGGRDLRGLAYRMGVA